MKDLRKRMGTFVVTAALALGCAAPVVLAQTAGQDVKDAGTDTKDAAKDLGHGVAKGTKKAAHGTKEGTEKAYDKTKEGTMKAADKTKVCFIYVGTRTDGGWTQAHENGRLQIEKEFGDKIETPYLESVPEGPDAERAIERMARSGCSLIFTTSFGYMDATVNVAKKFPKVKFEHATGFKAADNVATYNSRFYEGRYISGVIAGSLPESQQRFFAAVRGTTRKNEGTHT